MIFVDTSAWYAALVDKADRHTECEALIKQASVKLVTTDYVFDELITLLTRRGHRHVAVQYAPMLLDDRFCLLHWIEKADFDAAWQVFRQFADKEWSFTDCTSYAVMQRLGITEALSLDDHFKQFGFAAVRPG